MPPAARISDMHVCPMVTGLVPHVGGPIALGMPTVIIGGMPAARVGDMAVCVGPPDTIAMGSTGVFIGGMPAARMGDMTVHGGSIAIGFPTVMIGEVGGGGSSQSNPKSLEFPSSQGPTDYANWCGGDNAPATLAVDELSPEQSRRVKDRLRSEGIMPPDPTHATNSLEDWIPENEADWNRWAEVLNEEIGMPLPADSVDQACLLHDLRLGQNRTAKGFERGATDQDSDVAVIHAQLAADFAKNLDNPDVPLKGRAFARVGAVVFVGMTVNSAAPNGVIGAAGAVLAGGAAASVLLKPSVIAGAEASVLLQSMSED